MNKLKAFVTSEPFLALLALSLTAILLLTRDVSMSMVTQNMLLAIFTIVVLVYSAFIYRERPADEREYELSLIASKHACIVGSAILSAGIIYQVYDHSLDVWLPITLAGMVIAKTMSYFLQNK